MELNQLEMVLSPSRALDVDCGCWAVPDRAEAACDLIADRGTLAALGYARFGASARGFVLTSDFNADVVGVFRLRLGWDVLFWGI